MFRRTFAEVNLENLAHNYHYLRQSMGEDLFCCPMVKANAYGHGDLAVAKLLESEGASHLGVCLIEEGLWLRSHGVTADILVFRGFDRMGAEKIVQFGLTPVVSSWEHLEYLESEIEETCKVHLKFDTGMNRLGFPMADVEKLHAYFKTSKKMRLKAVLTHFLNGEDAHTMDGHSAQQLKKFDQIFQYFKDLNVYAHALNSGGILSSIYLKSQGKTSPLLNKERWGLRPGLALYGHHAMSVGEYNLKPVMTLKSVINNIRHIKKGETVSYGATWTAERDSVIAVVPIGYADGYHRVLSNRAHCLVMGERAPVVGRICMDYLMLDITALSQKHSLDELKKQDVILFGHDEEGRVLSPSELAHHAHTIAWEVLTSVGERVPRVFKGRPFATLSSLKDQSL